MTTDGKSWRGFATMKLRDPERHKRISRRGGKRVPPHLRAFAQDPDLAHEAAVKGGLTSKRGPAKPDDPDASS